MTSVTTGGELQSPSLGRLDLDWKNPRLPESLRHETVSQEELAVYIDQHYDALRVAQSIERHGFFVSEPLIGIRQRDRYIVVEGNRRLVALKALSQPELREKLQRQTPGWSRLQSIPEDVLIPVVVVSQRDDVDALLGFRHISGIEPWEPYAQARFIVELVERNADFGVVADIVGRSETEVRSMYRDYDILLQAKTDFGLDTSRAERSFGVFADAMSHVKLRDYIHAPAPRYVNPEEYPVPEENKGHLRRLLEYVFGDERGRGRVIFDSRQMASLGKVLADPTGSSEDILRKTRDLQAALEGSVPKLEAARSQLQRATRALQQALQHVQSSGFGATDGLMPLIDECEEALASLRRAVHE